MFSLHALLAPLMFPPSLLFGMLVRMRNALYSAGALRVRRLPATVISLGNLTLGGTGKTPLVVHVARLIQELGATPALLSRGYGRDSSRTTLVLSPDRNPSFPSEILGDEPALIRRYVPEIWLGISSNRYHAGLRILAEQARPVFILDDGFQHRKLARDLDIVVMDPTQPFADDRLFPYGSLREPIAALSRSHAVVINGMPMRGSLDSIEGLVRAMNPLATIFHCTQAIESLAHFARWKEFKQEPAPISDFASVFLVTALGNPARFRRDVHALGLHVLGERFFRDHHRLSRKDWSDCTHAARRSGAEALLITEKDAIKLSCPPNFPVLVAVQSSRVAESAEFAQTIKQAIERNR